MTFFMRRRLHEEFLIPVKLTALSPEETAEVFVGVANKHVVYLGNNLGLDSYVRIDREADGKVTYFHYWVYHEGEMCKAGSGGYIPLLHQKSEQILEFELKHFDPKGQHKLKDAT